jgi:hypothetical protein
VQRQIPTSGAKIVAVIELRCGRVHAESGTTCKGRFNSYALKEDGSTFGTMPATFTSQASRAPLPTRKTLLPSDDPDYTRQVNLSDFKVRRKTARCPRCSASYVFTETKIATLVRASAARGQGIAYLNDLT